MPWEAMDICADLSTIWSMPITDTKEQIALNFKALYGHTAQ